MRTEMADNRFRTQSLFCAPHKFVNYDSMYFMWLASSYSLSKGSLTDK